MASVWLSYFCGKSHFEDDGTQNYLVFQPIYKCFKTVANTNNPANIRLDEDVWKTSWRRLSSFFFLRRRLQEAFKRSWSRRIYSPFFTRLQKTSSRRLVPCKYIEEVFKTSCKDVFKTSSRRFQAYQQMKLFWLSCF